MSDETVECDFDDHQWEPIGWKKGAPHYACRGCGQVIVITDVEEISTDSRGNAFIDCRFASPKEGTSE